MLFAISGVFFNLTVLDSISFSGIGPISGTSVFVILTLLPLIILSPVTGIIKHEGGARPFRRFAGYIAYI
jgi:hypothetical protein